MSLNVPNSEVKLHDLTFVPFIDASQIADAVQQIAKAINQDYQDKKPLILVVMNGAFMFAADLVRALDIPCDIEFINIKSYEGINSSGQATIHWPSNLNVHQRHIIVVEDIIDTGLTMSMLLPEVSSHGATTVAVTAIFIKPDAAKHVVDVKYPGIHIPNDFVIGYGLDYKGLGRNLKDVYTLKS